MFLLIILDILGKYTIITLANAKHVNYFYLLFLPTLVKKMLSFAGIKIWAQIPKEIKENSYYSFKYKYKLFLISNYASDTQK